MVPQRREEDEVVGQDPPVDRAGRDIQLGKRVDQPIFQRMDEETDVTTPLFEVELDIADTLSGTVIGISSAAPGAMNRKPRRRSSTTSSTIWVTWRARGR